MKILDRYILFKLLSSFFFILIMLTIIIGVIDYTNKSPYFFRNGMHLIEVVEYYSAFLPFLMNFLTSIIVFLSVIFVTSIMSHRSEIIAILSAGVSYWRFLRPYLMSASVIATFSFVLMGWVLADRNKIRIDYEDRLGFSVFFIKPKYIHLRISPTEYLYIEEYRSVLSAGTNATIETIVDNQLIKKFYATDVYWLDSDKVWVFSNWTDRLIGPLNETITSGDTEQKKLLIDPQDLDINPRLYEMQSLPVLRAHIEDLKNKQSEAVNFFITELHVRYMAPFAALILTILGVTLASYRQRNGSSLKISIGLALAFLYIFMFIFARAYAESKGANIVLMLWTPNIIFSSICLFLYKIVPK